MLKMTVQYKDKSFLKMKEREITEVEDRIAREIAKEILKTAKENIKEMGIETTGTLRRSGMMQKLSDGQYVVKFTAPYSVYVEFGTNEYTSPPPLGRLVSWVQLKFGYDKRRAFAVAKVIQQEIFYRGTEPRPFLRGAVFMVQKALETEGHKIRLEGDVVEVNKKGLRDKIKEIIGRWLGVIR